MGGVSGSGFVYDEQNSRISVMKLWNSGLLMYSGSLRAQSQNLVIGGIFGLGEGSILVTFGKRKWVGLYILNAKMFPCGIGG